MVINDENSLFPIILDDFVVFSKMSQNLVEQLAARRRARGQALNSTLLAVMKEKDDSAEKTVISPPSKKVQKILINFLKFEKGPEAKWRLELGRKN